MLEIKEYDMSVVGCKEHIALAKKVAEEGITLIKNENVLPFDRAKTRTLALIGKLGDKANIGDHGSSMVRPAYVVTALEGLKAANPGCEVTFNDGSDLESAKAVAVKSIMMAYYPGQEGGTAIAEILYGDVNPSGKLPFVVPYAESDLPFVDWEATDQYYEYYHGYTRLDKNGVKPLVPYGFGLSYTTFETGTPEVSAVDETLKVKVSVKNTGSRSGDEVVQVYAGYENSAIDRPLRQLCGFRRVSLAAGEEKTVEITVPVEKLKWYNPVHRTWELEKMTYSIYAGTSEALADLKAAEIAL